MSPADQAQAVVATHLRELPNAALDAALDLVNQNGSGALVLAITDEFDLRHARHSIHPDLP